MDHAGDVWAVVHAALFPAAFYEKRQFELDPGNETGS
jgi:hypothetical protein